MTAEPYEKELDPTPLVASILEKSKAGKLKWEPTAKEGEFIASVGGETTLKVALVSDEGVDVFGNPEITEVPSLRMVDSKGHVLWEIKSSEVKGGLWSLYKVAQRVGNRLDERVAAVVEVLQKL